MSSLEDEIEKIREISAKPGDIKEGKVVFIIDSLSPLADIFGKQQIEIPFNSVKSNRPKELKMSYKKHKFTEDEKARMAMNAWVNAQKMPWEYTPPFTMIDEIAIGGGK